MANEDRIAVIEREVEALLGIIAGQQVALSALVSKPSDADQLKLWLASVAEVAEQTVFQPLTERQREAARAVLSSRQELKPLTSEIDPLRGLNLGRAGPRQL